MRANISAVDLLQSAPVERDRFVAHLYQARQEYRRTCETAGKSGKQIERCVIASFRIAESMGFKGDFRQWEDLRELEIDFYPRRSRSTPPRHFALVRGIPIALNLSDRGC
jgi:hypothetical protein